MPAGSCASGIGGASLEGGGGVCVEALTSGRAGSGGACEGVLDDERLSEPGRRLSSFMRLVDSVRRN